MTELLFYLAGSTLFLILAGLMLLLLAAGAFVSGRGPARVLQGILPFLLAGVVLSAPPLPRGSLIVWSLLAAGWWGEILVRERDGRRLSGLLAGLLGATTLFLVVIEVPRVRMPAPGESPESIHVIGDSLSAGIGTEPITWPDILEARTGISVINLASPGARLNDGLGQVEAVDKEHANLLVLLGGNDMLFRASGRRYEEDLRALLERIKNAGHSAILFELPVIPGFRHYGRSHRRVAADCEVPLVPARILARVLRDSEGTSDGIHLTDSGHRKLAASAESLFEPDR